MASELISTIRSGDWMTPERLRVYPLMLLTLFIAASVGVVAMSEGRIAPNQLPLGSDFSQVWVAGQETLAGHPDAPFDLSRHAAAQHKEFGLDAVFGWHYPPYFLAPAALLAHFSYLPALLIWQCSTLALYLLAITALLRGAGIETRTVIVMALAFPAVAVNLGHGQNGFLTAALLGGGFFFLDRRPATAGVLFGLLAYKPQFALALPLLLLLDRRWRTLGAAALTVAAMTVGTLLAFGADSWRAFFESLGFTRQVVELGGAGFEKVQTVFAAVRLLGGSVATAYLWQSVSTLAALATLVLLARARADWRVTAAAAICATLLTTPYSLDYDMMALAPAFALLVAHGLEKGFLPYEKSAIALAYIAPLFARTMAATTLFPLGVLSLILLYASIARYAAPERIELWREALRS